jgi:hypothetical protein
VIPEPHRVAIHQAGHAVVQTLVGRRRFAVSRVSIDAEPDEIGQGLPTRGEALLDRETFLGLYEFGLVTLAGIAAEECYLEQKEASDDPLVALSDLVAWQEQAWNILQDGAKMQLVSLNVMRKLQEWMADNTIWRVIERLADTLLEQGMIEGDILLHILAPLEDFHGRQI